MTLNYGQTLRLSLRKGFSPEDMRIACQQGKEALWAFIYKCGIMHQVFGYVELKHITDPDKSELLEAAVEDMIHFSRKGELIERPVAAFRTITFRRCMKALKKKGNKAENYREVEMKEETITYESRIGSGSETDAADTTVNTVVADEISKKEPLLAARIKFGLALLSAEYALKCLEKELTQQDKTKKEIAAEVRRQKVPKGKRWLEFATANAPAGTSQDDLKKFARASDSAFNNWKMRTLKKRLTAKTK